MVNKVILVGNLGADPKMNGKICTFTLATTETYKKEKQTEWHKIVAFSRLAEICNEYLTRGSKVYIEGKIETQKWTDKDDNVRYTTQIIAREMKMLSARKESKPHEETPEQEIGSDVPF